MVGMSALRLTNIPTEINARVSVPLSKSICNRSLILSKILEDDVSRVPLSSANDSQLLFNILSEFPNQPEIDVKDAGTVSRFMTALCAAQKSQTFVLKGTERMYQRPIRHLVNALIQLGADVKYLGQEGCFPLEVKGAELEGTTIDLSGAPSSQFASALLLISPLINGELKLQLGAKQVSRPYLDMTLDLLSKTGTEITQNAQEICISRSRTSSNVDFKIYHESDWSAAIYPLLINTLNQTNNIAVNNLNLRSKQGDSHLDDFLECIGYELTKVHEGIGLKGEFKRPNSIDLDLINTPDLTQPFACYCASRKIPFRLTGLDTLQKKETKRIDALANEFQKLGIESMATSSSLEIAEYPKEFNKNAVFNSYDDHRMAMSLFFLLVAEPTSWLNDYQCVEKSFPNYWNVLNEMGFRFDFR